MADRVLDLIQSRRDVLRYEPTEKRIRATIGGRTVVDSTRAAFVWEPQRIVPSYAVPEVLHPGHPFDAHGVQGPAAG